jgi:hypothetical protein
MRDGNSPRRWPARVLIMSTVALLLSAAVFAAVTPVLGGGKSANPGDSLYVSVRGSDSAHCEAASPCASFDRAYHVALPGQSVLVSAGTYPPQTITADPTKLAGPDVIFRSAPASLAVLSGLTVRQASHITFLGNSVATAQNLAGATSGLTLMPTPAAINSGAGGQVEQCSDHITFRGVDARQIGVNNSTAVSFIGGSLGGHNNSGADSVVTPAYYTSNQQQCPDANPTSILFSGVLFHDVGRELYPSAHPDCLQISGTTGLVIERSTFIRCGTSNILARPALNIWPGALLTGLVIRNNFFAPLAEGGNQMLLGATPDRCGTIDVEYNTSAADALASFSCGSYESLKVVGNYQRSQQRFSCEQVLTKAAVYDANVIGFAGGSATARSCGTHSRLSGDPRFVDEPAFNYRIQRGSPLVDAGSAESHPTTDIDGKTRPVRAAADAGAAQWEGATLIAGRSIGLVSIGTKRSAVEEAYGSPRTIKRGAGVVSRASYPIHAGYVLVTYAGDTVAGLSTTTPFYTSAAELGVGAPLPTGSRLRWVACRGAFVRTAGAVSEVFVPLGGQRGSVISALGWYRRSVALCGR